MPSVVMVEVKVPDAPAVVSSLKKPAEVSAVKPKVVEKVFNLPVVTDTYDSLANLSTPLHPYMEKAGSLASPVATTFKAGVESMTPEVIQTGYNSAKGQVCHPISGDI